MKNTCIALCAGAALAAPIHAMELDNGVEISGYARGGTTFIYNEANGVKGGLTLGGDLQRYRLGNEGDNGLEVLLAKTFESSDGLRYKIGYMPEKWNDRNVGTVQAYTEMSGLGFSPESRVWVGQRRLRIQDVTIVNNYLLNPGEYLGTGLLGVPLGPLRLGLTLSTADRFDRKVVSGASAEKLNIDIADIPINPGGTGRVLLTQIASSGFGTSGGGGVSFVHNQKDFLIPGLRSSLFLQTSYGLARINGEFLQGQGLLSETGSGPTNYAGLRAAQIYGLHANRVAHAFEWQQGAFGGQTLIGLQTERPDNSATTRTDFTLGGRIAYGFTTHFKLLFEAGTTSREYDDGRPRQNLNKFTIAPTLSLGPEWRSRPELRFYVTLANWNDAAARANVGNPAAIGFASTDGTNPNLQNQTLVGVQFETSF